MHPLWHSKDPGLGLWERRKRPIAVMIIDYYEYALTLLHGTRSEALSHS